MPKSVRILLAILSLILVLSAGFVVWGETPARPMPGALAALSSDGQVSVTPDGWLVFAPATGTPKAGFIIYPGGRVDYQAYAPAAHRIAAEGYLAVIARMPLNLAVLDAGAASRILEAYPDIQAWAIGGHSLGGAMAANFAAKHPGAVQGLVLWAAYPAGGDDLSGSGLKVVSISGTEDGLATGEDISASKSLLPADTAWVAIEGGNHAGFGWYGDQPGDNPSLVSREEQQDQVIAATLKLLEAIQ